MKIFVTCVLFLTFFGSSVIAAPNRPKPQGLLAIQEIADNDGVTPYSIQSDTPGVAYLDGLGGGYTGDVSVMMDNVCGGLTYGDRLLDLTAGQGRGVKFTLDSSNAVPGIPYQPLGTVVNSVRLMNKCTCGTNQSMYTMAAGSKIYCPMHARFSPFSGTTNYYVIDMGNDLTNGSERVQISCMTASSGHCNQWSIDPISDPDDTVNPGKTRANLTYSTTVHNKTTISNNGTFYMTYHIHVTLQ